MPEWLVSVIGVNYLFGIPLAIIMWIERDAYRERWYATFTFFGVLLGLAGEAIVMLASLFWIMMGRGKMRYYD